MTDGRHSWDELMATDGGFGIIVVSLSGALTEAKGDGTPLGDAKTAIVERFEKVGDKAAVTTWNGVTGLRLAHVIGLAGGFPADVASAAAPLSVERDDTFDGASVGIDADDGIRVLTLGFGAAYVHPDDAIRACAKAAESLS